MLQCCVADDGEAPASTHVERNGNCAQISYSPTLEQQNSVSSKGLNADFIIHYDVELRDIMGDIQVSEKAEFFLTYPNTD